MQDGDEYGIYARTFNGTTGVNITAEFRANYNTALNDRLPVIASLSEEIIIIVWVDDSSGPLYEIYGRIFNASNGENKTTEFRVNNYQTGNQDNPTICALSEDTFAVAWTSWGQDGDSGGIYARVFNATTGLNTTAEFQVNVYELDNQLNPSICALAEDTFAVAWQSVGQDSAGSGVYARVFNATTGLNTTAEFQVNVYESDNQRIPSTCALSEDVLVVAWESDDLDGSNYGVFARAFNATTGEDLTDEIYLNDYTTDDQTRVRICALSENIFAAAWQSDDQDGNLTGIYTSIFSINTEANISSEIRVNDYINLNQQYPSICALSNETFVVAWQSAEQDGDSWGVYAKGLSLTEATSPPIIPGNLNQIVLLAFLITETTETVLGYEILPLICIIGTSIILIIRKKNTNIH